MLGHVISWRTWTPTRNSRHTQVHLVFGANVISWRTCTRNSRHTQVHINYLLFGARPCYIIENMDAYKELKDTQVHINYLVFGARPCYIMENMDTYKELKAHTSTY